MSSISSEPIASLPIGGIAEPSSATYGIRAALMQLVNDAGLGVLVSWPGVNFTPPDTGNWLEVRLFENEPTNYGMANDATETDRGILQVAAVGRPGTGIIALDTLAQSIQAAFPKGTQILGPIRVTRQPWRLGDIVEDDRVKIPVTIYYSS